MADFKPPAKRDAPLPSLFKDIGSVSGLTRGNHWLGFEVSVLARNAKAVHRSADYQDARVRQSDSYTALVKARMRIAHLLAELADLPNQLAEHQAEREHARWQAEEARASARRQAHHDRLVADSSNAAQLARLKEQVVRAERNLEAAQRVKESEIDRWYAEAQARTNNAIAEHQDSEADLSRDGREPEISDHSQKERDLALIDHQIELERSRGNEAAVLALLNLKAMLRAA